MYVVCVCASSWSDHFDCVFVPKSICSKIITFTLPSSVCRTPRPSVPPSLWINEHIVLCLTLRTMWCERIAQGSGGLAIRFDGINFGPCIRRVMPSICKVQWQRWCRSLVCSLSLSLSRSAPNGDFVKLVDNSAGAECSPLRKRAESR